LQILTNKRADKISPVAEQDGDIKVIPQQMIYMRRPYHVLNKQVIAVGSHLPDSRKKINTGGRTTACPIGDIGAPAQIASG
jgi:hypothetical protein